MVREPANLKATLFNCHSFRNLDNSNLSVRDKATDNRAAATGGPCDGQRRLNQER